MMAKRLLVLTVAVSIGSLSVSAWKPQKESMKAIRKEIMSKKVLWSDASRVAVVDFVEAIKRAYESKDTMFLQSTFIDKTYLVKKKEGEKNEYINGLRTCFQSCYRVRMNIYGHEIYRMGVDGETFSMSMCVGYRCHNKKEMGYLFCLVDLNNPEQPKVLVWVWQKERDSEVNKYPEDDYRWGLYTGRNF